MDLSRKALLSSLFVLLASLLLAGAPAGAATVQDCQAQIDTLRVQTQGATFIGQNATKDQAGLLGKLDAASTALAAGKNADAIQKLTDFRTKVAQLDAQGKIGHEDAVVLIQGADAAIACVQGLQGASVAQAAGAAPSASLTLDVSPDTVAPGGTVTVSGSLTNTSTKTAKLTISYTVTGPCSYQDAYAVSVTLRAGETQTASATQSAPTCAGTYTITGTVLAGSTVVTSASTSFLVQ